MAITRPELLERLRHHEDSFVELKPEGGDFKPTLVAFANSVPSGREAVLFIGVRDDGVVLGLTNSDALQKKIQHFCQDTCYPPLDFTTELIPVDGKHVLAVVIAPNTKRPYFAGPAYVRVGTKNIPADEVAFEQLVTSRSTKAAELLRYRGQQITVVTVKSRLGYPEFARTRAGTTLHAGENKYECTLLDVNPFFARFQMHSTRFSEPLRNIEISYDEEQHRPLIIVNLDGA